MIVCEVILDKKSACKIRHKDHVINLNLMTKNDFTCKLKQSNAFLSFFTDSLKFMQFINIPHTHPEARNTWLHDDHVWMFSRGYTTRIIYLACTLQLATRYTHDQTTKSIRNLYELEDASLESSNFAKLVTLFNY